jgi:hypothetical protein
VVRVHAYLGMRVTVIVIRIAAQRMLGGEHAHGIAPRNGCADATRKRLRFVGWRNRFLPRLRSVRLTVPTCREFAATGEAAGFEGGGWHG